MKALKNIIVTGSNKGIGLGIVHNLAKKPGWNIIMAVRNPKLGEKAIADIKERNKESLLHL